MIWLHPFPATIFCHWFLGGNTCFPARNNRYLNDSQIRSLPHEKKLRFPCCDLGNSCCDLRLQRVQRFLWSWVTISHPTAASGSYPNHVHGVEWHLLPHGNDVDGLWPLWRHQQFASDFFGARVLIDFVFPQKRDALINHGASRFFIGCRYETMIIVSRNERKGILDMFVLKPNNEMILKFLCPPRLCEKQ